MRVLPRDPRRRHLRYVCLGVHRFCASDTEESMRPRTYRPAPPQPEANIERPTNRMLPRKYDRDEAEAQYIAADHNPVAIFEPVHKMALVPR